LEIVSKYATTHSTSNFASLVITNLLDCSNWKLEDSGVLNEKEPKISYLLLLVVIETKLFGLNLVP